ncbi:MAG TPA: Smr/MutS family protein, partial [Candidatus Izemoplasmatales bacterium]|nr:Smr/MutS family protein [Candidatus Izemoplasmatales bacterium]
VDRINLINARHPFIPADIVVPNTIAFKEYKTIVITGPNTGGKTVCLKTLGLLSLMVQSGMFIPADTGSETLVFDNVLADIGDEQSIEQSLSTFSSHITKIITVLKKASSKSLVLFDELGAGTDPKEGASLAISLLDYLRQVGCHAMVTTHYPELKVYAYNLDDVVNASVEFDIDSLKPTYRLKIGIPGTSNALEIAKRLGLEESIIEKAKTVSLTFDNETTNLIKKLEKESRDLETEIAKTREMQANIASLEESLKTEIMQSRSKQNKIISELKEQKHAELEKAKEQAMELIRELDGMKKNANVKEHELANMKYKVRNMDTVEEKYQKVDQSKIKIGDLVNVIPYQRIGVVTKQRNAKEFEVQLGVLSAVFSESDLEYQKKADQSEPRSEVRVSKEGIIHAELDLRGKRYEEAMEELDKYVDDCLFHHLEFASIIHGYGTGALKKGVEEYIKSHNTIKKSRSGGQNEGGHGVTIIYFK